MEEATNKETENNESTIDRLQRLTMDGKLPWRPYYNTLDFPALTDEALQEATEPDAYQLIDQHHGFGVAVIKIRDDKDEIFEPTLFVQGERIEASDSQMGILLDAIKQFLDDLRDGEESTIREQVNQEIESRVNRVQRQYEQELDRVEQELQREAGLADQAMQISENLSEAVRDTKQTQPVRTETSSEGLQLTAETLREAIFHYSGPRLTKEEFLQSFDMDAARDVISQIKNGDTKL